MEYLTENVVALSDQSLGTRACREPAIFAEPLAGAGLGR
jgi:hypothetical protein